VISSIVEAAAAANRILSMRPTKEEKEHKPNLMPPGQGAVGIEFKDVYFSYKGRDVSVLGGLNLKIEPGQFAALVGASGRFLLFYGSDGILTTIQDVVNPR
jgi:ATP-binding cassette, subfamily B (MDR/TAP), member 1